MDELSKDDPKIANMLLSLHNVYVKKIRSTRIQPNCAIYTYDIIHCTKK